MLILVVLLFLSPNAKASMFGEEIIPLAKLVAGQIVELEKLSQAVGIAKEERDALIKIYDGIDRTTRQIDTIQAVVERAQGLNPKPVQDLSDLNHFLDDSRALGEEAREAVSLKLLLTDQAIMQGAVQSNTAYKMGQEMIGTGSALAVESRTASPGRAEQITASAQSAQMLSSGVQLQTLAQIAQIQAMQLELQKAQLQKEVKAQDQRRQVFSFAMSKKRRNP